MQFAKNHVVKLALGMGAKIALGMGGGMALFIGGLMLPLSLFGEMTEGASRWPLVIFGSVCTAVGILCFTKLFLLNRRDKRFGRYAALIGNQKRISLEWLAQEMDCTREKAVKNIREAMSHGLFPDAYIDEANGLLLFPNDSAFGALRTVHCPSCGAAAEVMTGYPAKCRYCGCALDTEGEK